MALASVSYIADGATKQFAIPFGYILNSEVIVVVNKTQLRYSLDYTVAGSQVTLTNAPSGGVVVRVYRSTAIDQRKVVHAVGSILTEKNLNLEGTQLFYLIQELADALAGVSGNSGGTTIPQGTVSSALNLINELQKFLNNHTTTVV